MNQSRLSRRISSFLEFLDILDNLGNKEVSTALVCNENFENHTALVSQNSNALTTIPANLKSNAISKPLNK